MAKTKRAKRATGAMRMTRVFGPNVRPVVIEAGERFRTQGIREDKTPTFVGRVYTGVNRGKVYPYAGAKRGGQRVPWSKERQDREARYPAFLVWLLSA